MTSLRLVSFVVSGTLLVVAYLEALTQALPPLVEEGRELVVVPVGVISVLVFLVMHPRLRRASTHLGRLAIFFGHAAAAVLVTTAFLVARIGPPEPTLLSTLGIAAFFVLAQLVYGAPLVALLLVVMKLGSPLFLARPVRAWL